MLLVDLKPLVRLLNGYCRQALEECAGRVVSRNQYEITVEHLLLGLMGDPEADILLLLQACGMDGLKLQRALERAIEALPTGNTAQPVFSPRLLEVLQDAWLFSSVELDQARIRSGAILLAVTSRVASHSFGGYGDVLRALRCETVIDRFAGATAHSVEHPGPPGAGATPGTEAAGRLTHPDGQPFIGRYCEDLTEKARAGLIDPVFGRDHEIRQIIDILARRRKNNPLCVGDPGVGKTAVVEGLALRIVEGDVPEMLRQVAILGLDMGLLQAGASVKGEFESRLKGVIEEIRSSPRPLILFIDEAHTLIGAGGHAGTADAANLLKPALARGELRTIAATTWAEYKRYFEKDAALARRFQPVKLDEPDVATATVVLRGLKEAYERTHNVFIQDDAIGAAVALAQRYIFSRQLPDKAIDVLDTACARVAILQSTRPDRLEDIRRRMEALSRERRSLERDQENLVPVDPLRFGGIDEALAALAGALQVHEADWAAQKQACDTLKQARVEMVAARAVGAPAARLTSLQQAVADAGRVLRSAQGADPMIRLDVDPDVVAQVISDWTGVPLGRMRRDQAQGFLELEATLRRRVQGQDHAVGQIAQVLKGAAAGLKEPDQPMGVFLLVGPSGVGKTETAHSLADILFGDERSTIVINMSEFQERHSVSRLIGSPPGYVGYGEGGVLTEAVRQRPYCVVLLDEVEKAHPDVMNVFYQVFDKGVLVDGEGTETDFSNTVIFLTSNLAAETIARLTAQTHWPDHEALMQAVRPTLAGHFRHALLARMTVVPYQCLSMATLTGIIRLKLERLGHRMQDQHRMTFRYSPSVVDTIAARCTEVETGARNVDFILRGTIMPAISQEILSRMGEAGKPAGIMLDIDSAGTFLVTPLLQDEVGTSLAVEAG